MRRLQQLGLFLRGRFTRSHSERIELWWGIDALGTAEKAFGGEYLNFWIVFVVPELGDEAAGVGGFDAHLFGGLHARGIVRDVSTSLNMTICFG